MRTSFPSLQASAWVTVTRVVHLVADRGGVTRHATLSLTVHLIFTPPPVPPPPPALPLPPTAFFVPSDPRDPRALLSRLLAAERSAHLLQSDNARLRYELAMTTDRAERSEAVLSSALLPSARMPSTATAHAWMVSSVAAARSAACLITSSLVRCSARMCPPAAAATWPVCLSISPLPVIYDTPHRHTEQENNKSDEKSATFSLRARWCAAWVGGPASQIFQRASPSPAAHKPIPPTQHPYTVKCESK